MRKNKAFPGPGDRVRLAIPLPTDEPGPTVRYGTVVERSIGRSSALRIRWDDTAGRSGFAADGGTEGWLADAAWYWDRAHLRVVNGNEVDEVAPAPVRAIPRPAPARVDDGWLTAGPRPAAAGGQDGSVDAMAEWEAALASELDAGPGDDWDAMLARALGTAAPAAPARRPATPAPQASVAVRPAPPSAPPAPAAPAARPVPSRSAPQAEVRPTPPPPAVESEPPAPVPRWTGDDIIPRAGGKRRGRR